MRGVLTSPSRRTSLACSVHKVQIHCGFLTLPGKHLLPMGHIAAFRSDFLSAIGMNTPPEFQRTFGETLAHLAQVAQRVPFAAFGPVAEKPVND